MNIAFTQPTGGGPLFLSIVLLPLSDPGGGSQTTRFASGPVASVSGQFALCRPTVDIPVAEVPVEMDVRPRGLRAMTAARPIDSRLPAFRYDHHVGQVAVLDDGSGRWLVDAVAGPPTAPTTQTVDGEDPPSRGLEERLCAG
jgi:hypothetical protein